MTSQHHSHFYHFIAHHVCLGTKSEIAFHYTHCIMPASTKLASHIASQALQMQHEET